MGSSPNALSRLRLSLAMLTRRGSTRATELLLRELPAELAKGDERTVGRLLSLVPRG